MSTCAALYAFGTDAAGIRLRGDELARLATSRGWTVAGLYHDNAGTRLMLRKLQAEILSGTVRALLVSDLAELAEDRGATVDLLAWLHAQHVAVWAQHPPMDTTTADGEAMMRMAVHLATLR